MELEQYLLQQHMYRYVKTLNEVESRNPGYTDKQIIETIAKTLLQKAISEKNRRLLHIFFCNDLRQLELDEFLNHWDIETVKSNEALMLAYVQKHHPDLNFDEYTGPRLEGIFKYYRFQNLELIAHFSKIVNALNKQNITPMILKGGAMKVLRPELPRIMGDMDIIVSYVKDYQLAKEIVLDLGYEFIDSVHSFDIHLVGKPDKGILDIHQYLGFLDGLDEEFVDSMFNRAAKQRIFNAQVFFPQIEDLVYICLNNIVRNIQSDQSLSGIPFAIIDLAFLINSKKDFDWSLVIENIRHTNMEARSYLGSCFVNQIVPDLIPVNLMNDVRYSSQITEQLNYDRKYLKSKYDNKLLWRLQMFHINKVRKGNLFDEYPRLLKVYLSIVKIFKIIIRWQ